VSNPDNGRAPLVTVVIPTRNRPTALRRCLASLAAQAYPAAAFETVVVDDGSTPAVTPDAGPGLRNLRVMRQEHAGAARARMTGVGEARSGLLAFVDDDCALPADFLATAERVFRTRPDTQVAQVRILNPEPDNPYGRLWTFNLDRQSLANLRPAPDGRLLSATLGGVMVARREVFREVAFDARLRTALEDADLSYQLAARGIAVHYEPELRVFHHVPTTLAGYLGQFWRYGRGAAELRRKWRGTPAPFRYCRLTGLTDLRALVQAEGRVVGPTFYALLWLRRLALAAGSAYEVGRRLGRGDPALPPR
jgi:GT2 family glycosyltransferase